MLAIRAGPVPGRLLPIASAAAQVPLLPILTHLVPRYGGRLGWDQRAIVSNDKNFRGRGNPKGHDMFHAAPNIDHTQDFVQRDISDWMRWLRTEIGFDGWRFDFVRGFSGSAVRRYLEEAGSDFAVGEYWDSLAYDGPTPRYNQDAHRQRIVDWITAAGTMACAFDVTLKGILHAVFEKGEYWRLRDHQGVCRHSFLLPDPLSLLAAAPAVRVRSHPDSRALILLSLCLSSNQASHLD